MINMPHRVCTVAPLPMGVKLNAINQLRQKYKLAQVNNVPPANITLTPAVPIIGQNYLVVTGVYDPSGQTIFLRAFQPDQILLYFPLNAGKTYLLDVCVQGNIWQIGNESNIGSPGPVTAQGGHLLIPFIAGVSGVWGGTANLVLTQRNPGNCAFISAQLTQVN